MKTFISTTVLFLLVPFMVLAQKDTLFIFGPGGPYPAIHEAAEQFSQKHDMVIAVTKGPLPNWKDQAHTQADLIYSGSEDMMSLFMNVFEKELIPESIEPLYFRKSGLIVRKGNPKKIKKLEDLRQPGISIMVVNGAGLSGVWEDMLGNLKDKRIFRDIRRNITHFATNSGVAQSNWHNHADIDVWITWDIWQKMNADQADFIPVKKKYTVWRDCGIGITQKGKDNPWAESFYQYLQTAEAHTIFKKWGWK